MTELDERHTRTPLLSIWRQKPRGPQADKLKPRPNFFWPTRLPQLLRRRGRWRAPFDTPLSLQVVLRWALELRKKQFGQLQKHHNHRPTTWSISSPLYGGLHFLFLISTALLSLTKLSMVFGPNHCLFGSALQFFLSTRM